VILYFKIYFLLLAGYVLRCSEEECMTSVYILRTNEQPTDLAFCKISNGHISATGRPIHFIFGSICIGFSGSVDRTAKIEVRGCQPSSIILKGHTSETIHPIQFVFGSRVKVWEKIMREGWLGWSQSKTFLVLNSFYLFVIDVYYSQVRYM